jgi:uncharacterized membrane protein required for colicin V production
MDFSNLNMFDYVGLGIIGLFLLLGLKKGFLKELAKVLSLALSVVGAKILGSTVEIYLYDLLKVKDKLLESVTNIVSQLDFSSIDSAREGINQGISNIVGVGPFLSKFANDNWTITDILQTSSSDMQTQLTNALMNGIEPMAHKIMGIISFVLVFIVLSLVLGVLFSGLQKAFSSIKILGFANTLLGGVLGAAKGIIITLIVFFILFIVFTVIKSDMLTEFMNSELYNLLIGIKDTIVK